MSVGPTMRATTQFREDILANLDDLMEPLGFARRLRSHVFRKELDSGLVHWIHLSLGLYERTGECLIHPSVGVRYSAIERERAAAARRKPSPEGGTFSKTLHSLTGRTYHAHLSDPPSSVAKLLLNDWKAAGAPAVERMSDVAYVIRSMKSESPDEWCCVTRSERGRLLLLALLHVGAHGEALALLPGIEAELEGRDQFSPPFSEFRRWFEARVEEARTP